MGKTEIEVPRDRQASFDSIILPKHKRDVSDIENKVLAMYARGMSQRDISATIVFVDYLFVPIKRDYETKECAVYNILGIRVDGRKEIFGLWIQGS